MLLITLVTALSALHLVEGKIILPNLPDAAWSTHNGKIKTLIDPINFALSHDLISPSTAAQRFSKTLFDYLTSEPDFISGGGGGGRSRRNVDISDEALQRAKEEKKRLQRLIAGRRLVSVSLRREFYEAIRNHNYLKRLRDKERRKNDAAAQERWQWRIFLRDR